MAGKLVAARDIAWPAGTEIDQDPFSTSREAAISKSERDRTFHITNLVQHYALANRSLSFLLVTMAVTRFAFARSSIKARLPGAWRRAARKAVAVEANPAACASAPPSRKTQERRSSRDELYLFVNAASCARH